MVLQERGVQLDKLAEKVIAFQRGSAKRNVVFSYSPRGSGKTQLVKWFLSEKRANAVKWGRVIVRCCDRAAEEKWIRIVKGVWPGSQAVGTNETGQLVEDVSGVCELIRAHVEAVTGRLQNLSSYLNPNAAYETWKRETASHFEIPADHI